MPETIRTANERLRSRAGQSLGLACVVATFSTLTAVPAQAEGAPPHALGGGSLAAFASLGQQEIVGLTLTLGLLCFAVLTAIILVRTRAHASRNAAKAHDEVIALRADIDRFKALLMSEPQILASWAAAASEPEIVGDTSLIAPGMQPQRVLAFGTWLEPAAAQKMDEAVDILRAQGRGFVMTLVTNTGRPIEAEGRAVGGRAVLRLRNVSGIKRAHADLAERYERLRGEAETLRALIDALPSPVWARDDAGNLTFANPAYAHAVEAAEPGDAVERGVELFGRSTRDELARAYADGKIFSGRARAVVAGQRRHFDVVDAPGGEGSAGIAIDVTEIETLRAQLAHMAEAHRRVLDQLATGVAVFAADRKLAFYNTAFRSLWDLDAGFLDQAPADGVVLDRLRAERKLPEEQNFREWKAQLHEAYRAVEAQEHLWHLPDGRTVRVVTTPNPEGGVTYIFHDVTERLDMARRFEALIKVQSETLDHLAEAVTVFASDGRVRLFNPAFASMWKLAPDALTQRPHVDAVTAWCQALHDDNAIWRRLRTAVTAIDNREPTMGRIERRDGVMIDCTTMPLPDGATLVTFQDVTDTINIERALRERNEALETADHIKVDFVHHVSYELRSPLTNIVGFAHFLADPAFGALNDKQREYLGYITVSTNALLAIINNILDLATIDAGAMPLNLGDVDIRAAMQAAAEGVQDRLVKENITLDIRAVSNIGSFTADERRLRQILFNLLANAIGFSPPNETVTMAAERHADAIVFSITDRGPGIPPDKKHRVFDWFETDSLGSEHRGAGLGLSLVRSFVELHGGTVTIESAVGQGTTVTCVFPLKHAARRSAA
ncbi:MAG: PAS-domain containing protein [Pseudolabrys sp.]